MPVEYAKKPEGGDIRDNLKNVPMSDQLKEASEQYSKYLPSVEEIKKIARLIEKTTKMEVSKALKDGEIRIKVVPWEEAERAAHENAYALIEKYIPDSHLREGVRERVMRLTFFKKDTLGFFDPLDNSVDILADNLENTFKLLCEELLIKADSPKGRRLERYLFLSSAIHESIHQTINENNPAIRNAWWDAFIEGTKILQELAKGGLSSQEKEKILARMSSADDKKDAMRAYDEGVAHYTEHKIMCKLGYSDWAEDDLREVREQKERALHSAGTKFIQAIQVRTHQNPIEYTIKHPPTSMRYIENPDEYLKAREEGKI